MYLSKLHRTSLAVPTSMRSWLVERYGSPLIKKEISVPKITQGNHVLIRVKAASVNPIDARMTTGYGDEILKTWRQVETMGSVTERLPLITGRDCCGEVVDIGSDVKNVSIGEDVIAVVPGQWQGSHAEYVLTKSDAVAKKPISANYIESTTLPYVACTSWQALVNVAQIKPKNAKGIRVLIHGGSGGMGSAAIQMLKAWGADKVVATCSEKNSQYVVDLGGIPVDYNSSNAKDKIIDQGPYDVILDCVDTDLSQWSDKCMGIWRNSVHVSVISPMLRDSDRYGVPMGLMSTAVKYLCRSVSSATQGKWFSYAYFLPNRECLEQLSQFIDQGQIKIPHIEKVYKFNEVPEAYAKVSQLHTKGKLVIDFAEEKLGVTEAVVGV